MVGDIYSLFRDRPAARLRAKEWAEIALVLHAAGGLGYAECDLIIQRLGGPRHARQRVARYLHTYVHQGRLPPCLEPIAERRRLQQVDRLASVRRAGDDT